MCSVWSTCFPKSTPVRTPKCRPRFTAAKASSMSRGERCHHRDPGALKRAPSVLTIARVRFLKRLATALAAEYELYANRIFSFSSGRSNATLYSGEHYWTLAQLLVLTPSLPSPDVYSENTGEEVNSSFVLMHAFGTTRSSINSQSCHGAHVPFWIRQLPPPWQLLANWRTTARAPRLPDRE